MSSAIRELIQIYRSRRVSLDLPEADAAEAELRERDEIAAVQRKGVQAMAEAIAERDRRDAELLEAWRTFKPFELDEREQQLTEAFERWAKGGGA